MPESMKVSNPIITAIEEIANEHLQTDHWLQALQVTIFHENVGFGNMRIITLISIVSWLPISSSSSPFTYKAVEVIFGSIYFFFHLQTAPTLQDCSHSHNLPTFPESTLLAIISVKVTVESRYRSWSWRQDIQYDRQTPNTSILTI